MDLVEFLRARLDDEERLARDAASEGEPSRTGWQLWTSKIDTTPSGERLGPRGSIEASPARVLADVEAKRRIVNIYQWHLDYIDRSSVDAIQRVEQVAQLLALPFADHPDYEESWRP